MIEVLGNKLVSELHIASDGHIEFLGHDNFIRDLCVPLSQVRSTTSTTSA